jgi:hypothetical protein
MGGGNSSSCLVCGSFCCCFGRCLCSSCSPLQEQQCYKPTETCEPCWQVSSRKMRRICTQDRHLQSACAAVQAMCKQEQSSRKASRDSTRPLHARLHTQTMCCMHLTLHVAAARCMWQRARSCSTLMLQCRQHTDALDSIRAGKCIRKGILAPLAPGITHTEHWASLRTAQPKTVSIWDDWTAAVPFPLTLAARSASCCFCSSRAAAAFSSCSFCRASSARLLRSS